MIFVSCACDCQAPGMVDIIHMIDILFMKCDDIK